MRHVSDDEYVENQIHVLEYYLYLSDRESVRQRKLIRSSVVFDCRGCCFKQFSIKLVARLGKTLSLPDKYYPETVGETFIVNAPWVIHKLYSLLKVFLSYEIQSRVFITGKGEDSSKALLDFFNGADLPNFVIPAAESVSLSDSKLVELGFSSLSPEQSDALIMNQTGMVADGTILTSYRIGPPKADAAGFHKVSQIPIDQHQDDSLTA